MVGGKIVEEGEGEVFEGEVVKGGCWGGPLLKLMTKLQGSYYPNLSLNHIGLDNS